MDAKERFNDHRVYVSHAGIYMQRMSVEGYQALKLLVAQRAADQLGITVEEVERCVNIGQALRGRTILEAVEWVIVRCD